LVGNCRYLLVMLLLIDDGAFSGITGGMQMVHSNLCI